MRAFAVAFFSLAVLPLLAQHGRYLSESNNPAIGNPQAIASGTKLFMGSCAGCHGPDGTGGARGPNLVRRSLWHPLSDDAIFKAIRNGVPGTDMPPTKLTDEQTWNLVAFIHAIAGPASTNPVPGDPSSGKAIYWSAKAGCSNCHAILGTGGRTAPDLSNVGGSRPLAVIRESIVQPNKDMSYLGNEAATVVLKNGQTLRGVARNRSNYSLQLVDTKGVLHLLKMADVQRLTLSESTPMPTDYATRLTKDELRDLLAYLAKQDTRAAQPEAPSKPPTGASAQPVTAADIDKGPNADWLTYAGTYSGWRYSPLNQITAANVKNLVPKWVYHVPGARGLRSSPIVYQGTLYITNTNSIYAIDARTGRLIWQYADPRAEKGGVNRGAAIWGDKIYFTTSDNYLIALDRQTGSLLFNKQFADVNQGTTSTSAPVIVKGKVIVGSAGGDSGMRGFLMALSADTGEPLWKTYTVPAKGEKGSESWGDLIEWGGGAAWLSGTYDPDLNTLYWTTGNPWPDYNGSVRSGDNLYTCSLLALDLDTGKMKWYFQFTPHDTHDWDAQSWPVLVDTEIRGQPRKVVLHANRNGYFYALDRVTGEFLRATPLIDKITWAKGIDDKGRPITLPNIDPTPQGNWVCPSVKGATNWMGQSYNPNTGLLYVLTLEQCGLYFSSSQKPQPMKNFSGGGATEEGGQVILRALDPKTGNRAWEYPMTGSGRMWTGTVSTAGGILFSGDDDGHVVALDAKSGKNLWHFNVGEGLTASPVTYSIDGNQYIAIASATAVFSFGLFEPITGVDPPVIEMRK